MVLGTILFFILMSELSWGALVVHVFFFFCEILAKNIVLKIKSICFISVFQGS